MPEVLLANLSDLEALTDDIGMTPPASAVEGNLAVYGPARDILVDSGSAIAALIARANHTGVQAISTVTGLQTELDAIGVMQTAIDAVEADLGAMDATLTAMDVTLDAMDASLAAKLDSASYTAANVLTKLLTVDGAGSGVDADLLDGQESNLFALLASPTFTGTPAAPTATFGTDTTQLSTTAFVQAAIAAIVAGNQPKTPVRILAITNVVKATALENGDTLQVVLATGDRVALTGQSAPAENGIWVVQASGTAVRATDMNAAAEFPLASFLVTAGTYAGTQWQCNNATAPVVDTDAISIVQTASGVALDYASSPTAIAGVATDEIINPATLFAYHRNFEGPRPVQYFGVTFDGATDDAPFWNDLVAAWEAGDADAVQCPAGESVIESKMDPIVGVNKSLLGAGGASIITIPTGDTRGTFFEFGRADLGCRNFKLSGFDMHCDNATVAATESALLFGRAAEIVVSDMFYGNVGTIAKFGTVSDDALEIPNQIVLERFHGSSDRVNATCLINIKAAGGLHFRDWWVSGDGDDWQTDTTAAYIKIDPSPNGRVDTLFFDRMRMSQYNSANPVEGRAHGLYALWNAAGTGSIVNLWMNGCCLDYTTLRAVLLSGSATSDRHGSIVTLANNRFYTAAGKGVVVNNAGDNAARQWTDINIHDNLIGIIDDSPGLDVDDNDLENMKNCTAHHNHISDSNDSVAKAYGIRVDAEGWDIAENTVGATQSDSGTGFAKSVSIAKQLYRTRVGHNPIKKANAQYSVTATLGVAATTEETPHFAITKGLVLPQTRLYLEAAQALSYRAPRRIATLYDDVIGILIEADVWRLLDGLFIYSPETGAPSLLNMKTPGSLTMTATASPTHTKWRGYTFNGTTQNLNFAALPSAFGQYAQNDASLGVWVRTRGGVNHTIGNAAGDTDAKLRLNTYDATNMTGRLNADADATIGAVANGTGLSALSRSGSTQVSGYKNGVLVATVSSTSVAPSGQTSNNRVGQEDNNEWTTDEVSAVFYGAALDAARQAAIYRALNYWQTVVGA